LERLAMQYMIPVDEKKKRKPGKRQGTNQKGG